MEFTPHSYQERAIQFATENESSALLLDMGLGKTSIVLTSFNDLKYDAAKAQSMLVIAPLRTALLTWRQEAAKWDHLKHLKIVILHGKDKESKLRIKADIYVINYDGLAWLAGLLAKKGGLRFPVRIDLIVFDESTMVKTPSSRRSEVALALSLGCKRKMILTGTPTPNNVLDLWHQIKLLDGGERLGSSYTSFRTQNFVKPEGAIKYFPRPGVTKRITDDVGDLCLTMKAEDYLDMPDKIMNTVDVCLPEKSRAIYDEFEKEFFVNLEGDDIIAFNASSLAMKLRQTVQGFVYDTAHEKIHDLHTKKVEALREIVDGTGGPVLVAIQFRYEAEMLKEEFGDDLPIIYGGTTASTTVRYVQQWNRGQMPILVAHPASMAHGVNLQSGGHTMVWLGLPWSLEHYLQFIARLYRQGQTEAVMVHHIIMKDTIDEVVMRCLEGKEAVMADLVKHLKEWKGERR